MYVCIYKIESTINTDYAYDSTGPYDFTSVTYREREQTKRTRRV